jgi:hypothetical protein
MSSGRGVRVSGVSRGIMCHNHDESNGMRAKASCSVPLASLEGCGGVLVVIMGGYKQWEGVRVG